MPRSKKKIARPVLSEKDKLKVQKQARRKVLKETGLLAVPYHKVHISKKKYNRKQVKKAVEEDLQTE